MYNKQGKEQGQTRVLFRDSEKHLNLVIFFLKLNIVMTFVWEVTFIQFLHRVIPISMMSFIFIVFYHQVQRFSTSEPQEFLKHAIPVY